MNLVAYVVLCLVTASPRTRSNVRGSDTARIQVTDSRSLDDRSTDSAARQAEVALWNAYRGHSRARLAALLAPSFVNVDSGGETGRAQILAGLDDYLVSSVDVDIVGVTRLSDSAVLVRARVRISHTWKGRPLPGDLITSTIWKLSSGRVRAVYHQDTGAS